MPSTQPLSDAEALEKLQAIPAFDGTAQESLERLLDETPVIVLDDGEMLVESGKMSPGVFLVLDGTLSVHQNSIDDEPLAVVEVGEIVGELSYIDEEPATVSVMSRGSSSILALHFAPIVKLPDLAGAINRLLLATAAKRTRTDLSHILLDRQRLREQVRLLEEERRVFLEIRKNLEKQSLLLRTTVDAMSQGISVFDANLNLTAYNKRFVEILGLPEEIVDVGTRFDELIRYNAERGEYGDGDPEQIVQDWVGRARRFEDHKLTRERPNGTIIEISGHPVPDGGWYTTYTDITDQVRAKEQAQHANEAKSSFLAHVSHEMRTPLTPIRGYSEILRQDFALEGQAKAYLEIIEEAARDLQEHIDKLLDFTKIERDRPEIINDDFDLQDLSAGRTRHFQISARAKGLKLDFDSNCSSSHYVYGDAGKLRDVLSNLISNAIKCTDSGKVHVSVQQMGSDQYRFEVADTGSGISSEEQQTIFNPYQMTEKGKRIGGWGLGLHISKKNVELMGGQLMLDSELGRGAKFSFILTLPPGQDRSRVRSSRRKRVIGIAPGCSVKALVVDDTEHNRNILSDALERIGVTVLRAEDAVQADTAFKRLLPDIVFIDVKMPDVDGFEVRERLHRLDGGSNTRFVAISATFAPVFPREHYLSRGFADFLAKPFRLEAVYACLSNVLTVPLVQETWTECPNQIERIDMDAFQIPRHVHSKLIDAAAMGRIEQAREAVVDLKALGSDYQPIANHLDEFITRFDMSGFSNALNQCQPI